MWSPSLLACTDMSKIPMSKFFVSFVSLAVFNTLVLFFLEVPDYTLRHSLLFKDNTSVPNTPFDMAYPNISITHAYKHKIKSHRIRILNEMGHDTDKGNMVRRTSALIYSKRTFLGWIQTPVPYYENIWFAVMDRDGTIYSNHYFWALTAEILSDAIAMTVAATIGHNRSVLLATHRRVANWAAFHERYPFVAIIHLTIVEMILWMVVKPLFDMVVKPLLDMVVKPLLDMVVNLLCVDHITYM